MYLDALRRMTPEQRLAKVFELNELSRALFLHGLRRRFPDLDEQSIQREAARRLLRCHSRNS
jgi:hypothetical protein